ncbi:PREDICTED: methyl-CpG-binding domain-containing protein 11-like [Populus euphratica]|uniref:Methyl-CpG-binding domain-containing protein 11-like n=1 Tax=Populus euphratica TaxID=75702 RepID=A0AAJ6TC49_POPEU|nr:PREDICTED: methyl-CpG-binding domain-containing protein 11-like [Populus euphratica]
MEHRQYLRLIGGTGETPRRSARISEKAKATPPEKKHPKKRGQKSSGSKKDETGTITEETEGENEVQMQDAGIEKGKADEENYGNAKGFQQALEVKERENAGEAVKDKAAEEAGSSEVAENRAIRLKT